MELKTWEPPWFPRASIAPAPERFDADSAPLSSKEVNLIWNNKGPSSEIVR